MTRADGKLQQDSESKLFTETFCSLRFLRVLRKWEGGEGDAEGGY